MNSYELLAKLFLNRSTMTSDARIPASKWLHLPLFAAIFQVCRTSLLLRSNAFTGQAGYGLFFAPAIGPTSAT